jgi:hypothetical protein
VSNTRRATGVPAALTRDGTAVPPSPDVEEHSLAQVIGEAVALHVSRVLAPVLGGVAQLQTMPACVICVQERKQAERAWLTAVANAQRAAEPEPGAPEPPVVLPAVTWVPLGQPGAVLPVCYGHFPDGPQVRATGLVNAAGAPIIARN